MPEIEVPPIRTPVSMQQYADACRSAWIPELGGDAPYLSVAVLWGQYMVETGGPHCYCWNLGNVKRIKGDGNPYYIPKGNRENGLPASDSASMFRAFPDLATAMRLHLRFLYSGLYQKAWNCIIAFAPEDCARELYDAGYYTGGPGNREEDIRPYAQGMRFHFTDFTRRIPVWDPPEEDRIVTVRDLSDVVSGSRPE